MRKLLILLAAVALLSSCKQNTNTTTDNKEVVTEATFIALSDIQAKGAEFVDQEIQTKGIVDHVCRHSGKKILLVNDDVKIHVLSEERYEDNLVGKEIIINAIVKEDRTDESTLLKIEEDAINSHKDSKEDSLEKETEEEIAQQEARQEQIISYVNMMRDSLKASNKEYFSEYYLEFVSLKEANEEAK